MADQPVTGPVIKLTITDRDGANPVTVEAELVAPGLAVHAAKGMHDGWALTHVPTGRRAGWWPNGPRDAAVECGRALPGLGDWDTADMRALPLAATPPLILEHGGWLPTKDPFEYWALERGKRIRVSVVGALAEADKRGAEMPDLAAGPETAHRDPWQEMSAAAQRFQRALFIADEQPHAHAADEVDLRRDEMSLAALALVRHLSASPDGRPPGWEQHPVDGTPDDPSWAAHRACTCGACGLEFGTNCRPGDIACPECNARLCSLCGHWEVTGRV